METEKKKKWREIHERETALQIARLLEKKREHKEQFWIKFNDRKNND